MGEEKRLQWMRLSWRALLPGTGAGVVALLGMTAVFAWMISREVFPVEWMKYSAVVILLVSGFLAGLTAKGRGGTVVDCLGAGGCLWLVLLTVNAAGYGCGFSGIGVVLLTVLGGAGACLLLTQGRRPRRKKRRVKYAYR